MHDPYKEIREEAINRFTTKGLIYDNGNMSHEVTPIFDFFLEKMRQRDVEVTEKVERIKKELDGETAYSLICELSDSLSPQPVREEEVCAKCGTLKKFHPKLMNEYTGVVCEQFVPITSDKECVTGCGAKIGYTGKCPNCLTSDKQ